MKETMDGFGEFCSQFKSDGLWMHASIENKVFFLLKAIFLYLMSGISLTNHWTLTGCQGNP